MRNVMKTCFESTFSRLRRGGWQKIIGLNEYAQKWLEPLVQDIAVHEAVLHESRIVGTCGEQILEEEGCEGDVVMHTACQECGCVFTSERF